MTELKRELASSTGTLIRFWEKPKKWRWLKFRRRLFIESLWRPTRIKNYEVGGDRYKSLLFHRRQFGQLQKFLVHNYTGVWLSPSPYLFCSMWQRGIWAISEVLQQWPCNTQFLVNLSKLYTKLVHLYRHVHLEWQRGETVKLMCGNCIRFKTSTTSCTCTPLLVPLCHEDNQSVFYARMIFHFSPYLLHRPSLNPSSIGGVVPLYRSSGGIVLASQMPLLRLLLLFPVPTSLFVCCLLVPSRNNKLLQNLMQ